jgi:hypothetical protein
MIYIPSHGSHGHLQTLNKWYYLYNNGFTLTKQNNNKIKNKLNIVIRNKIFTNIRQSMLKLKTHSGFHDLFRFWYVWEYKYGIILWLEDGNLYLRLRKMSHTIYVTRIILHPLSALFGLQFMLPMEKSVTFTSACANDIIPNE